MPNADQLAEMEQSMMEEHRKDREALDRLKRFLPKNGSGPQFAPVGPALSTEDNEDEESLTIIAKVEEVMTADLDKKWTVPKMVAHLKTIAFPLVAKKPASTMGLVFKRLQKRGRIRIVKRGAGRNPNVWRANLPTEGDSDSSAQNERPTQRQAVHLQ